METKTTVNDFAPQRLPAGVALNDHNIEFVGCKDNKTVIWLQHGNSHAFEYLPHKFYTLLLIDFINDKAAQNVIKENFPKIKDMARKVELYTYFMYGDLDTMADIKDGKLQPNENFRDTEDCISLAFEKKTIHVDGVPLKRLYVKMMDAWAKGVPDKAIASQLGKAHTTYDFHKSKLFKILNVNSKPEAVAKGFKQHVLCAQ